MQDKIEKAMILFNQYQDLRDLTDEEANNLCDLTYLFFANLIDDTQSDLYGAMIRAVFNMGYESGQKTGGANAESE